MPSPTLARNVDAGSAPAGGGCLSQGAVPCRRMGELDDARHEDIEAVQREVAHLQQQRETMEGQVQELQARKLQYVQAYNGLKRWLFLLGVKTEDFAAFSQGDQKAAEAIGMRLVNKLQQAPPQQHAPAQQQQQQQQQAEGGQEEHRALTQAQNQQGEQEGAVASATTARGQLGGEAEEEEEAERGRRRRRTSARPTRNPDMVEDFDEDDEEEARLHEDSDYSEAPAEDAEDSDSDYEAEGASLRALNSRGRAQEGEGRRMGDRWGRAAGQGVAWAQDPCSCAVARTVLEVPRSVGDAHVHTHACPLAHMRPLPPPPPSPGHRPGLPTRTVEEQVAAAALLRHGGDVGAAMIELISCAIARMEGGTGVLEPVVVPGGEAMPAAAAAAVTGGRPDAENAPPSLVASGEDGKEEAGGGARATGMAGMGGQQLGKRPRV
jgi:hypothetical protein